MAASLGKKGEPCPVCGRDWDDVMFILACGCTMVGHSGSPAAQHIAAGKPGTLVCGEHPSTGSLVTAMVTLNDPGAHDAIR